MKGQTTKTTTTKPTSTVKKMRQKDAAPGGPLGGDGGGREEGKRRVGSALGVETAESDPCCAKGKTRFTADFQRAVAVHSQTKFWKYFSLSVLWWG